MKQHLKSYIELIVLYVHWINRAAITFEHSRLGMENKFFPSEIIYLPTYTTFIL